MNLSGVSSVGRSGECMGGEMSKMGNGVLFGENSPIATGSVEPTGSLKSCTCPYLMGTTLMGGY